MRKHQIFILAIWAVFITLPALAQEKINQEDQFAKIGSMDVAVRTHLLKENVPAELPEKFLPVSNDKNAAFETFDLMDTKEELDAELDLERYESDAWHFNNLKTDISNWQGLPCYNKLYFTHLHVLNQSDMMAHQARLSEFWMEACIDFTRDVFELVVMFGPPHGYQSSVKPTEVLRTQSTWDYCAEIPGQVLKNAIVTFPMTVADLINLDSEAKVIDVRIRKAETIYRHTTNQQVYHLLGKVPNVFHWWLSNVFRHVVAFWFQQKC